MIDALTKFKLGVLMDELLSSGFAAAVLRVVSFSQIVLLGCVIH